MRKELTDQFHNFKLNLNSKDRFILSYTYASFAKIREFIANQFISSGLGYEIGAQASPISLWSKGIQVKYVDYISEFESAEIYGVPSKECVHVDIISNGIDLGEIETESASFLMANHVLEHISNPVKALIEWLRVLKFDGILFLTVPNYSANAGDFLRNPASVEHIIDDFIQPDKDLVTEHLSEHCDVYLGWKKGTNENTECIKHHKSLNLQPHYHVFNKSIIPEILGFLERNLSIYTLCEFELSLRYGFDLMYVIRKKKGKTTKSYFMLRLLSIHLLFLYVLKLIKKKILKK